MPGEIQNAPPQPIAFGKYTLLERISHGGMAEVFRAKTQGTAGFERVVAIKLLLPQVANDADFVTMLIDEAKIAGQLSHANIAQIFDLGQVDGRYFIVQEYVPGRDLRAILHHLEDAHGRLGVAQSCHIILKICEALDYAHNKRDGSGQPLNLVHRDISPQNVIVSHEGEVKLIDFGIVKAEGRATRTLAGLVKGKFAYMSPEQIRGLPVDRRSDVFACGILLHELLTGVPLFKRGSEFETLQRARSAEVEPPSRLNRDVTPELDRIVLKALTRHVDDRYQTAVAVRDDLWEFVRASGQYHTRDQLSAWMRGTFGETASPDLAPARSPDELKSAGGNGGDSQPGPDLGDGTLYGDEEPDNMTVVDSDLVSRLRLVVEDADTVAADADEAGIAAAIAHGPADAPAVPALRDLAEAAQSQPERAVFRPGGAARMATGSDPSLDLGPVGREGRAVSGQLGDSAGPNGGGARAAGGQHGDDEETTGARQGGGADELSPWFEPQTPTRRRTPAPEAAGAADADPDDHVAIMEPPAGGAPLGAPAGGFANPADDGISETASTSPFMQLDPIVAGAVHLGAAPVHPHGPLLPQQLSAPPPPSLPSPMAARPQGPIARPDARTLAPFNDVPAPVQPGPPAGAFPPVYQLPAESAFPPPAPDHMAPDHMVPDHMVPDHMMAPPGEYAEYGPPPGPMQMQQMPQAMQSGLLPPGPFGPPPMPPEPYGDAYGPAAGMWPGQPMPGAAAPDAPSPSARYWIAAALGVLVAAVIVSIVLAVTGA